MYNINQSLGVSGSVFKANVDTVEAALEYFEDEQKAVIAFEEDADNPGCYDVAVMEQGRMDIYTVENVL